MKSEENKTQKDVTYQAINPEMIRILDILREGQFTMSKAAQSSRILNHYDKKGIMLSTRENTQGWRRFNVYDLVWLDILDSLRAFGYPLEWIKKIRDEIMHDEKTGTAKDGIYFTTEFEWYVALSVSTKKEIYYIVLEEGVTGYNFDQSPNLWYQEDGYLRKPHISLPLTPIIKKIWQSIPGEELEYGKSEFIQIDKTEKDIISEIRSGKYERINILFKNKKPERIIGIERKEIKRIEDVLRDNKFQKIELIQNDGKIVSIISEVSKKLK